MSKVIIHISDLHVTTYNKSNGAKNEGIDSYLDTNTDSSSSIHFIDTFTTKIKAGYPDSEFILVITGDITNWGEKVEFEFASIYIQKIIRDLNIELSNCLILPGDHDVHRRSLENVLDEKPNNESHLLNNIKFKNFSIFYKEITGSDFPFDSIIINHIIIDDKVILLGLNSNYKINNEGGDGFIPIEEFRQEFESLKKLLNNDVLNYLACWHHNFSSGFDDKNKGQWEATNRIHLLAELEKQNIKFIFTGNEHTSCTKSILLGSVTSSDCGAFSSIKYDTTFKVYPIIISSDIKLENKIYALQKTNGNDIAYFWDVRNNKAAKQPDTFDLFVENTQSIQEVDDQLPHSDSQVSETITVEKKKEIRFYNNKLISEKLYNIIKEKKLYHSGHFHWSDTSRAHNWIDVSKLLENKEDLYFVKNAIINVIETFNLNNNCDLIIGLGYEGNIISSKASIKFNIPYTSLPYSYRYNDHDDYEKKLNFDNNDGKYKKVIILTDVVNDGRTIRKLIAKRATDFFKNVTEIIVVSLFYTGHQEINTNILNSNMLPAGYDFINDHEVNNIEFYTVKSLRVERCPYGKDYKKECFIYMDDLSCVHLFYDEIN